MKHAIFLAAAAALALAGCSREDAKLAGENVKTTIGELVTPSADNPDNTLIVRQAQLKERKRQNTSWTDENISAHPDLYLRQCQEDITAAIAQYDALLLSMRKIKSAATRTADEAAGEIARFNRFLDEARPALADASTPFPVTVSGFSFTREQLIKQLSKAIKEKDRLAANADKSATRAKIAQVRIDKLEKAREAAQSTLRDIEEKIVEVKANKVLQGVDGIKSTVGGILDTITNLGDDEIPLDVLGAPSAAEEDEEFVRKALGL